MIKYKYYTFVNVFGLVCGMLSVLIIAKYVGASVEMDSFHANKGWIYSITQEQSTDGNSTGAQSGTYLGMADLIMRFPEASDFTRYSQHVESLVLAEKDGNRLSFTEGNIFVADSNFLKIFTFPLIHGDRKTALSRANSIVLTESTAKKYFGDANPIGETVTIRVSWGRETTYQVTAVAYDITKLSQFGFDFLIPQGAVDPDALWNIPQCSLFLLLRQNANADALAEKLTNTANQVPQLRATNRKVIVSLLSLAAPRLSTEEYMLVTVAIFIALICWTNYINQIIAQSYWRIKQIGLFRIMGATRSNLHVQFLVECCLVCLISLFLVIALYAGFEQTLQTFANGHLLPLSGDPTVINLVFFGIFIIGIVVSMAAQAMVHFSHDLGKSLLNAYSTKPGGLGLRKALVVVQFSIATILIISIFVIADQLNYLDTQDKGMNMDNILVIKAPIARDTTWIVKRKTLEVFKQRCGELPFVSGVTSSTTIPGEEYRNEAYLTLQGSASKTLVHQNGVDDHFFSLYEIEFIAGHDFIPDARAKNRRSIILNETAAKAMGISDYNAIIDAKVVDHEEPHEPYSIIGIVKDHHKTSMKYEVRPMAYKLNELRGHSSFKINSAALSRSGLAEGVEIIRKIWQESYPDAAFDHFFLRDKFAAQDSQDRNFGKLFRWFTLLSIIISCLGLFGLSLLISTQRQKEVAIRKTFGASSATILIYFLKGYLTPLAASFVIGAPVAYLMMGRWLQNYAYRIDVGFGLVALALATLSAVFFFTVSYSTIKSSITNPVMVLRD
ncbi:MAG: ABC transporter permease [Bacteroidota bacterium]|nr:ABC transporter permease [Bacteroidota bacterium]